MNILQSIENIIKETEYYITEKDILRGLKLRGIYIKLRSFITYMDILVAYGKIVIDEDSNQFCNYVYYIGVDNPKLEKLLKESISIK